MMFSDSALNSLSLEIEGRLSHKRYAHTLGVASAARRIASYFPDIDSSEITAAALLHDITKEYSEAEHKMLISENDFCDSLEVLHSFSAPSVIRRDFPTYATENVLRSVYAHTVGAPDMTLFDEIIFIADYVEDGRTYHTCVKARDGLYTQLDEADNVTECEAALHRAVAFALSETVKMLKEGARPIHPQTQETLDAMLLRIDNTKG